MLFRSHKNVVAVFASAICPWAFCHRSKGLFHCFTCLTRVCPAEPLLSRRAAFPLWEGTLQCFRGKNPEPLAQPGHRKLRFEADELLTEQKETPAPRRSGQMKGGAADRSLPRPAFCVNQMNTRPLTFPARDVFLVACLLTYALGCASAHLRLAVMPSPGCPE